MAIDQNWPHLKLYYADLQNVQAFVRAFELLQNLVVEAAVFCKRCVVKAAMMQCVAIFVAGTYLLVFRTISHKPGKLLVIVNACSL